MKDDNEYYKMLVSQDFESQKDYDKTVLSLSGGGLGISLAFVKDIIGSDPITKIELLISTWIVWGLSVAIVLTTQYFNQRAYRKAINQLATGEIYNQPAGGVFSRIVVVLKALGGILFLAGVILLVIFVYNNLL